MIQEPLEVLAKRVTGILLMFVFSILCFGCSEGRTEEVDYERISFHEHLPEVDVMVLKRTTFHKEIVSNGKLKALRKSDLKFKVGGQLKQLKVRNGYSVKSGEAIAMLDPFEFNQRLEHAQTAVKKTSIDLQDALLAYGGSVTREKIPDAIYEGAAIRSGYLSALNDLKTAQYNVDQTILKAPFSGKIANLRQNEYELVNSGEVFCTLIDDSIFEAEFHLIESEIGEVSLDDKVKILPFSKTEASYGFISEINPLVDESGLILVRATITNGTDLWEGMNVNVIIEKQDPGHLIVPKSAVVLRQNQEVLFKYANGLAIWTYVETGLENSTSYAAIANREKVGSLQEGDTIIISNNLNLAHESRVSVKTRKIF